MHPCLHWCSVSFRSSLCLYSKIIDFWLKNACQWLQLGLSEGSNHWWPLLSEHARYYWSFYESDHYQTNFATITISSAVIVLSACRNGLRVLLGRSALHRSRLWRTRSQRSCEWIKTFKKNTKFLNNAHHTTGYAACRRGDEKIQTVQELSWIPPATQSHIRGVCCVVAWVHVSLVLKEAGHETRCM